MEHTLPLRDKKRKREELQEGSERVLAHRLLAA